VPLVRRRHDGEDPRKDPSVLGVTTPEHLERGYRGRLYKRLDNLAEQLREALFPVLNRMKPGLNARADAADHEWRADGTKSQDVVTLQKALEGVRLEYGRGVPDPEQDLQRIQKAVDNHNATELRKDFQRVASVDPLMQDPRLQRRKNIFVTRNLDLIKDVDRQVFDQVNAKLTKAVREGRRHEELIEMFEKRLGVARSRAKLIARDQVSKFNSDLNRVRQRNNGITRYKWITVGDGRVRDEHDILGGTVRRWGNPHPTEGHPGDAVQCRCIAAGIVANLVA